MENPQSAPPDEAKQTIASSPIAALGQFRSIAEQVKDGGVLLAIGLALLYAAGVLICWIADARLGVGSLGQSRERGIVVCVAYLLFVSPMTIVLMYFDRSYKAVRSVSRLKATLYCVMSIPALVLLVQLFFIPINYLSLPDVGLFDTNVDFPMLFRSELSFVWTFCALFVVFHAVLLCLTELGPRSKKLHSAAIRVVIYLGSVVLFGRYILPLIPAHIGGHNGPICTVELASKSLKGKIKYSDADQLVIEIDNRNILIPKSEVKSITTEPKVVRATTPAPKK